MNHQQKYDEAIAALVLAQKEIGRCYLAFYASPSATNYLPLERAMLALQQAQNLANLAYEALYSHR